MNTFFLGAKKVLFGIIKAFGPTILFLAICAAGTFGYLAIENKVDSAKAARATPSPYVDSTVKRFTEEDAYNAGRASGYESGFEEGKLAGYRDGYKDGSDDSYSDGYSAGFEESRHQVLDYISDPIYKDHGFAVDEYFDLLPALP